MNTRIAPSPTGHFHLGTARTAYFNWLAARSTGGKFTLRIDDTDMSRNNDDHVTMIYDTMAWLGLDFDVTFKQSDRLDRYSKVADMLLDAGFATKRDGAIFFNPKTPDVLPTLDAWNDGISGIIRTPNSRDGIDNMVLIKSDGTPSYHFATVVDDRDFGIDWIIRGVDHIPNTVKHKYIDRAIMIVTGVDRTIRYSHVGLIHYKGKKLSKRDGASGLDYYRNDGYRPDAMLNALLMLGWGQTDPLFDKKYPLVDKQLAVKLFPDGKMKNYESSFNLDKLKWFNKKYKMLSK